MNKLMTIGMTAVMAAGIAGAQNDVVMVGQAPSNDKSITEVTGEIALVSAYVWRGQVLNNDIVMQPQITASSYGVSVNIWGNYDLGENNSGNKNDFSEMDVSLAYDIPLDLNDMVFSVGLINYNFPNTPDASTSDGVANSTTELFGKATVLTLKDYVIPSVTLFGDIRQADGIYLLFDIVAPYEISDYLYAEAGASAGWGDTSYNDYYWGGDQEKGFNDFNLYANLSYEIFENLTASANLTYTFLDGGAIRNAAKVLYENDNKFWGGVNLAYDF
ncbi:MAG: TorF family putative porin [Pontiella sp.]